MILRRIKKITDEIGIIYTGNPKILKKYVPEFWNNKTGRLLYDWKKMKNIIILIPVFNDWGLLKTNFRN